MAEKKKLTPLMEQYYGIKAKYPGAILFFRMGDFYEMFGEDAKIASQVLGITLTSRNHGSADKTLLAGVPYHAADNYLPKLLAAGLKVAVCEQIEDPKKAKGLVKRDVVETHTPGTITERMIGDESTNRYIVSIMPDKDFVAIACSDVSTGEFWTKEVLFADLIDEFTRIEPKEVVFPESIDEKYIDLLDSLLYKPAITYYPVWNFEELNSRETLKEHFGTTTLDGFGKITPAEISACGALLSYFNELKKRHLSHITGISIKDTSKYLMLDNNTVRNLELLKTVSGDTGHGTLFCSLDESCTPMGKRLLKNWLIRPLVERQQIDQRLSAVQELISLTTYLDYLRNVMCEIGDLERLAARLGLEKSSPREFLAIAEALTKIPSVIENIKSLNSPLMYEILENLDPLYEIKYEIENTIAIDAPILITGGGFIKKGISPEVDELREITKSGDNWIRSKEEEIKSNTGITKLKIKYNKVFGYFIEIPKGQSNLVPDDFIRKQTLVNQERFITPELKDMEVKVMSAHERIVELERDIFFDFRARLAREASKILNLSSYLAILDVLQSFAFESRKRRFVRPTFNETGEINIKEGRHPVVEDVIGEATFVPNNTFLDGDTQQIIILTGPNMSGKSTYLRQVAINTVMAQCGCFVAAEAADLCIIDKLFCRVGASDNIVLGRSTFLTEMIEAANILNNCTTKSLVLLDEIGRGTSTYDGLSIAWAITEFLHDEKRHRAKTIFATHYHELTILESMFERIKNFQVMVQKSSEMIKFLHRIAKGGCDDSYGVYVAKLAGIPESVLARARELLITLEKGEVPDTRSRRIAGLKGQRKKVNQLQIDLFEPEYHPLVIELQELNLDNMTPIKALELLYDWSKKWGQLRG